MARADQVNLQRTLTLAGLFYAAHSAGRACLLPFLSLYLRQLGLSATQTGVIYALKAFVALWSASLWNACAVHYGRRRMVLMLAVLATIASHLGLTLLPPADESLYFSFCIEEDNASYLLNGSTAAPNHPEAGTLPLLTTTQPAASEYRPITSPINPFPARPTVRPPSESSIVALETPTPEPPITGRPTHPPLTSTAKLFPWRPTPPDKPHLRPDHTISSSKTPSAVHSWKPKGHKGSGLHSAPSKGTKPSKSHSKTPSRTLSRLTHTDSPDRERQYNTDTPHQNHLIPDDEGNAAMPIPQRNSQKHSHKSDAKPSRTGKAGTVRKHSSKGTQPPSFEDTSPEISGIEQNGAVGKNLNKGTHEAASKDTSPELPRFEETGTLEKNLNAEAQAPVFDSTGAAKKYPSIGTPFSEVTSGSDIGHWASKAEDTVLEGSGQVGSPHAKHDNKRPGTSKRQKIHALTGNHQVRTNHRGEQSRGDSQNVVKRSAANDSDELRAKEDQMPRSLGPSLDSLSKTVASFLEFQQILFVTALLIMAVGETLSCPVDKICDSALYETLDAIDELDKYGRHAVPSAVGYGLCALAVTLVVDHTACRIFLEASHFMIHFYSFAFLMGLAFILALFYPVPAPKKGRRSKVRLLKGLKLLLGDPHNAALSLTMVVAGALASNVQVFLFWRVQDLGGAEAVMGAAVLVAACSRLPMLSATGWLVKKLGPTGVLVAALLSLALRLLCFALLWTPWAVVPLECLCALSQQALWQTAHSHGEQISPPAMERSVKATLDSLYHGLGFAVGSAVGGVVYDCAGLQVLYGASAAVGLLWAVALVLVARLVPRKKKHHYSSLLLREEEVQDGGLTDEDSDEVYGNDWLVKALKDDL